MNIRLRGSARAHVFKGTIGSTLTPQPIVRLPTISSRVLLARPTHRLDCPRDLILGTGLPNHTCVADGQSLTAEVAHLGVGRVDERGTEAAVPLAGHPSSSGTAGVDDGSLYQHGQTRGMSVMGAATSISPERYAHAHISRCPPWRVKEEIVWRSTLGASVHRALLRVTDRSVHGLTRGAGCGRLRAADRGHGPKLDRLAGVCTLRVVAVE